MWAVPSPTKPCTECIHAKRHVYILSTEVWFVNRPSAFRERERKMEECTK